VTTQQEADERRLERARQIALFRYSLIQDVISPHLTAAQRGRRVRQLAAMTHPGPDGAEVRVSCQTINRWKRDYLAGGFDALVPSPRQASPRTPGEVLTLAAALKRENPERSATQVQRIMRAQSGWAPSDPDAAADVRPARAEPAARRPWAAAGIRPVRSHPAQRAADRRCPPVQAGPATGAVLRQAAAPRMAPAHLPQAGRIFNKLRWDCRSVWGGQGGFVLGRTGWGSLMCNVTVVA
jgi:hypothetical protein